MKKVLGLGLFIVAGLVAFGAACQPAANVTTNSSVNKGMTNGNTANQNAMTMNANQHMSMNQMQGDPDAASAPYDLQFIDTMSAHHKGAIEMAEVALKKSSNEELKKFAQNIITDQNKEIAQMKDWREKWFKDKAAAKNMEMAGMMDSMKMMMGDGMSKWESTSGKDFDLMFLNMMTPHHQGAVTMANEALKKAEHPEIKTLAQNIIKAQEAEIKQMAEWKAKWSK